MVRVFHTKCQGVQPRTAATIPFQVPYPNAEMWVEEIGETNKGATARSGTCVCNVCCDRIEIRFGSTEE